MKIQETIAKTAPLKQYFIDNRDRHFWGDEGHWLILSPNPRDKEDPVSLSVEEKLVERMVRVMGDEYGIAMAYRYKSDSNNGSPDLMFISRN